MMLWNDYKENIEADDTHVFGRSECLAPLLHFVEREWDEDDYDDFPFVKDVVNVEIKEMSAFKHDKDETIMMFGDSAIHIPKIYDIIAEIHDVKMWVGSKKRPTKWRIGEEYTLVVWYHRSKNRPIIIAGHDYYYMIAPVILDKM